MAQTIQLKATNREQGNKALAHLRGEGSVPGIVYGQGKAAQAVAVSSADLDQAYQSAGTSRLVELSIDGQKTFNTLFVDSQIHPVGRNWLHFDLYTVKMDEAIETEIPIHFEGNAPAVYNLDGVLVQNLDTIEVSALPNKLPENFTIDLEKLEKIGASVHVSDLVVPEGVEILTDAQELIVKIDEQRSEAEMEELDQAIDEDAEAAVEAEHGTDEAESPAPAQAQDSGNDKS